MIHFRGEGDPIKLGFSFYRPSDPHSIGGHFRVGPYIYRARWSKSRRRLFLGVHKDQPVPDWAKLAGAE